MTISKEGFQPTTDVLATEGTLSKEQKKRTLSHWQTVQLTILAGVLGTGLVMSEVKPVSAQSDKPDTNSSTETMGAQISEEIQRLLENLQLDIPAALAKLSKALESARPADESVPSHPTSEEQVDDLNKRMVPVESGVEVTATEALTESVAGEISGAEAVTETAASNVSEAVATVEPTEEQLEQAIKIYNGARDSLNMVRIPFGEGQMPFAVGQIVSSCGEDSERKAETTENTTDIIAKYIAQGGDPAKFSDPETVLKLSLAALALDSETTFTSADGTVLSDLSQLNDVATVEQVIATKKADIFTHFTFSVGGEIVFVSANAQ
jgi:hypothetical protein